MPALRLSRCLAQLGWSAIVWQQHPLHAHRFSTDWTAHHSSTALTSGWRWHHLNSEQLEQLQLAAHSREAAAHSKQEQAVVAYFDEALALRIDSLTIKNKHAIAKSKIIEPL